MSGPPYPRVDPDSNAIGNFVIGVSSIGTIPPFDFWRTIISQYSNSPILTTLISNFFDYIDQTINFDNFFDNIWNLDTAQGFGLDVWGRILGVSRILEIPSSDMFLGFEEAGDPNFVGFNQAPFYSGVGSTSNFALSDTAYRFLLFAKAFANISDGSIASINQILLSLFPRRGNCYVVDGLDMTMEYVFEFQLSAVELAIVLNSGVLPRPVGVSATVVVP